MRRNDRKGREGGDRCIVNHEYRFIYVDVPKVASSSVKAALIPLFPDVRAEGNPAERGVAHRAFGNTPHRVAFSEARERFPDYLAFVFVRNPWDRLLSCFHSKVSPRRVALRQPAYPGGEFYPGMPFDEFCEVVAATPDEVANLHYRSQHTFFGEVDFLGRFERMEKDFAELCKRLDVALSLPHVNPNRLGMRTGAYREHYDARLAALVAERFREDSDRFGYVF